MMVTKPVLNEMEKSMPETLPAPPSAAAKEFATRMMRRYTWASPTRKSARAVEKSRKKAKLARKSRKKNR